MLNNGNAYWPNTAYTYLRIFKIIKEKKISSTPLACRWHTISTQLAYFRQRYRFQMEMKSPLFSGRISGLSLPKRLPLSNHWKSDRQKFAVLLGSCFEKPYICPVII